MCAHAFVCVSVCECMWWETQQPEQAEAEGHSTEQADGGQLSFEQKGTQNGRKNRTLKRVYLKWLERSYYCTADLH